MSESQIPLMPAKAGIQKFSPLQVFIKLDSRLRGSERRSGPVPSTASIDRYCCIFR
jgi:hypothetical protein